MAEYIEREAAIDAIMKVYVRTAGYKARERVFEAEEAVHRLPATDVVPVVRCKDCQNLRQSGTGWWCCEYGGTITPQDYCSRAERITNTAEPQRVPWEAD